MPDWLGPLVEFNEAGAAWDGDWNLYIEEIYRIFQETLAAPIRTGRLRWKGIRLGLKRYPESQSKESTFWHLVSEGESEESRTPALNRCARIRWPGALIPRPGDSSVLTWLKDHKGSQRIHMYLIDVRYLFVLDYRIKEGNEFILPWTAYPVERDHTHEKLIKAFESWKKQGSPLPGTP